MKKIYCLGYGPTANIGDEIQTLAAKQALAKLGFEFGGLVDRDTPLSEDRVNLLINGFIPHESLDKLISNPKINPIFTNLHLAQVKEDKLTATMAQLKKFAPIGCRDRWTTELLQSHGVDAFFNYCMTLTFDRRTQSPTNGRVIFVDQYFRAKRHYISKDDMANALEETHNAPPDASHEFKFAKAQELLDKYRDQAKLVITSRLHCALPCLAMGIPVIIYSYFWNDRPRLELVEEFIPLYMHRHWHQPRPPDGLYSIASYPAKKVQILFTRLMNAMTLWRINWHPQPMDIEDTKQQILKKVDEQINLRAI